MDELIEDGGRRLVVGDRAGGEVDILGIGFGSSNLSLAIAIEEFNDRHPAGRRLTARFVDVRRQFGWHDGMLLPGATMQISFLKDLVSLRTPTSPFTFLNYLQEQGRLSDFINLKTFFPTRREFHGYLSWASLLSNVAVRAADILRAITDEQPASQPDHHANQQRLPAAIRTDPR
ncbi:lysine N(6)-hydroxylase/L-ornithine N(5)-oxygenase family protein [Streptomyces sp. SID13031]|nr:lysine N(6)-hydroxylase/L-ornithine N(5)-oxygenase family protein [Streptomyces sp. SID13031]